jgi:hypothetical protein
MGLVLKEVKMTCPKLDFSTGIGGVMNLSNGSGMEIGHRYCRIGDKTYNVGDIIPATRFYVSAHEFYEGTSKLKSTNVKKQTANFTIVGKIELKHA